MAASGENILRVTFAVVPELIRFESVEEDDWAALLTVLVEEVDYASRPYLVLVDGWMEVVVLVLLVLGSSVCFLMSVNLDNNWALEEVARQVLKVVVLVLDVEKLERFASTPFSILARDSWEVIAVVGFVAAAVLVVVVVEADESVPYNAVPIPSWRLVDFLHPSQQKPAVSYTVECLRSTTSVTYLTQSSSALIVMTLVESSLLLVFSCPLLTLHAANSSWIPLRPAIVAEEQVVGPWADSNSELPG